MQTGAQGMASGDKAFTGSIPAIYDEYLVPVLFAYTNFIGGSPLEVISLFLIATLGVYALGAAIEGHMEAPLNWPLRILAAMAGVALMWPNTPLLEIGGGAIVIAILVWTIRKDRQSASGNV